MSEYIEPNRNEPSNCDACFAIADLCDWHGQSDGANRLAVALGALSRDPEAILLAARPILLRERS